VCVCVCLCVCVRARVRPRPAPTAARDNGVDNTGVGRAGVAQGRAGGGRAIESPLRKPKREMTVRRNVPGQPLVHRQSIRAHTADAPCPYQHPRARTYRASAWGRAHAPKLGECAPRMMVERKMYPTKIGVTPTCVRARVCAHARACVRARVSDHLRRVTTGTRRWPERSRPGFALIHARASARAQPRPPTRTHTHTHTRTYSRTKMRPMPLAELRSARVMT
jgi:hypothetical protein